jgi:hypothetical protein
VLPVHSLTVDGKHFCCITSGCANDVANWELGGSKHQGMSTSTRYIDHQGNSAPSWGPERMYVRGEWDPKLFARWGVLSFLIVLLQIILWLLYCIHFVIALLHSFHDCSITNHCDCFCKSFWLFYCIHFMIALLHSFCDCAIAIMIALLQFGGNFSKAN